MQRWIRNDSLSKNNSVQACKTTEKNKYTDNINEVFWDLCMWREKISNEAWGK